MRRGRTSRYLKPDDLVRKDAVEVPVLRPVKKVLQREVEVLRSCRDRENAAVAIHRDKAQVPMVDWEDRFAFELSADVVIYSYIYYIYVICYILV